MHDILKRKILFSSLHLPKSPPEGGGPLGGPFTICGINSKLMQLSMWKKVILLKHQGTE